METRTRSPSITAVFALTSSALNCMEYKRLKWAGNVARMEEGRSAFKMLTGKPTGKRPLGRLGVDGRTILEWTLKR